MPIYEFRCCSCEKEFEVLCPRSGPQKGLKCPSCGKKRLVQIPSCFSARASKGGLAPAGKPCSRLS